MLGIINEYNQFGKLMRFLLDKVIDKVYIGSVANGNANNNEGSEQDVSNQQQQTRRGLRRVPGLRKWVHRRTHGVHGHLGHGQDPAPCQGLGASHGRAIGLPGDRVGPGQRRGGGTDAGPIGPTLRPDEARSLRAETLQA